MKKERVSIIICACDSYKKLWPGLLKSIEMHLGSFSSQIYFTASKSQEQINVKNFKIRFLNKSLDKKSWSERLIKTIKSIDSEYFLLLIEDYYLENNACTTKLNECLNFLSLNNNVGYIKLSDHKKYLDSSIDHKIGNFIIEKKKANYRISAQAGLWKKSYALKLLRKGEDAWYFEHNASFRSRFYKLQPLTYDTNNGEILQYFNGKLMEKGNLNKEIASTIEKKDGISFDNFSIDVKYLKVRKSSQFSLLRKIYNRIYLILSIYIHFRYL